MHTTDRIIRDLIKQLSHKVRDLQMQAYSQEPSIRNIDNVIMGDNGGYSIRDILQEIEESINDGLAMSTDDGKRVIGLCQSLIDLYILNELAKEGVIPEARVKIKSIEVTCKQPITIKPTGAYYEHYLPQARQLKEIVNIETMTEEEREFRITKWKVERVEEGLIKEGLIRKIEGGYYEWLDSKVLFDFFIGVLFGYDHIATNRYGEPSWEITPNSTLPIKEIKVLFKGIGDSPNQQRINARSRGANKPPQGWEKVYDIVKVTD